MKIAQKMASIRESEVHENHHLCSDRVLSTLCDAGGVCQCWGGGDDTGASWYCSGSGGSLFCSDH